MNKLIQTIALTAVVCSPLSLVTAAVAHHTASHVSTVAVESTKTAKSKLKKTGKKPVTTGAKKKPATDATTTTPDTTTPATGGDSMKPNKPTTKPETVPSSKIKPGDSTIDNSMGKPAPSMKVPTSGTNLPTVPTSTTPSVSTPTGLPK